MVYFSYKGLFQLGLLYHIIAISILHVISSFKSKFSMTFFFIVHSLNILDCNVKALLINPQNQEIKSI